MADVETPGTTETTGPAGPGGVSRWTRLAALGLAMAGLGPLVMFLGGLIFGADFSAFAGFLLVATLVPLVAAFLVYRFGLWAKIVGLVAGLLVLFMLWWTVFGLLAPHSFLDFIAGVLVLPGGIIAVVGSIGAIVAERRGHRSTEPVGGERRALRLIPLVVGVLAILSLVLTFATGSTVAEGDYDTTVELTDFEFENDEYEFEPGTRVRVRNAGAFLHTFTIEELDIDEFLTPGDEALVVVPDSPGEYVLFCRPHTGDPVNPGEDDMAATARIQ